jgi:hypothetical protein
MGHLYHGYVTNNQRVYVFNYNIYICNTIVYITNLAIERGPHIVYNMI